MEPRLLLSHRDDGPLKGPLGAPARSLDLRGCGGEPHGAETLTVKRRGYTGYIIADQFGGDGGEQNTAAKMADMIRTNRIGPTTG